MVEAGGEGFETAGVWLAVVAAVSGGDDGKFQLMAAATKEGCPVSSAIKGNVQIDLKATLSR